MDSEHRHQLHSNDLAKFIAGIPEYIKNNQKMVIYVIVVAILVVISAYMTTYKNKNRKLVAQAQVTADIRGITLEKMKVIQGLSQGQDNAMMLSNAASKLIGDAEDVDNDLLKAIAKIKAGNTLRAELYYKPNDPEKSLVENQIKRARQNYLDAIELADGDGSIVAMAKLGLGLCQEELGNFDKAREIYSEIVNNDEFKTSSAWPVAKIRANTVLSYARKVKFAPAPPKPVEKPSQNSSDETDLSSGTVLKELNFAPAKADK